MRVLFTTQPLVGHFHSLVPLAQAVADHGHEVAFATSEMFGPVVARAGFDRFPCGQNCAGSNDILTNLPEWPALVKKVSHPGIRQLWAFIQGLGPQMAADLIDLVPAWKPDVIVRDPLDFGSYIAGELFDVPHASILWAIYISPRLGATEPLNALRQQFGLPEEPDLESFDRYLVLNALPPSWELMGAVPPVTHRFRMPPFDLSVKQDLPAWVHTLPDRPTVYATLGTAFNKRVDWFRAFIAALASEDFNAIVTVGQSIDPAQFDPLPPQVKLERYVPQSLLFPHCSAIIFHGGFNTLITALWHSLPMIIVPQEAGDQQPTGEQVAASGAGVLVDEEPPQPETIRAAVDTVLDQPSYRLRAQHFQREIMERLPDLSEAVQRLETLARTRQPQPAADR